jgi:uncharacterized protein YkwD
VFIVFMVTTFLIPAGGNRHPGTAATPIDPMARLRLLTGVEPRKPSRHSTARQTLCAFAAAACAVVVTPSFALDLNSFRAQHGRSPLSQSIRLTGAAYGHAQSLAARQHLDHSGFRQRVDLSSGPAAENVAYGCSTEDCVIRMWARSGGHRANMLRRDVTSYGLASANGANGKRYWVLELGN